MLRRVLRGAVWTFAVIGVGVIAVFGVRWLRIVPPYEPIGQCIKGGVALDDPNPFERLDPGSTVVGLAASGGGSRAAYLAAAIPGEMRASSARIETWGDASGALAARSDRCRLGRLGRSAHRGLFRRPRGAASRGGRRSGALAQLPRQDGAELPTAPMVRARSHRPAHLGQIPFHQLSPRDAGARRLRRDAL